MPKSKKSHDSSDSEEEKSSPKNESGSDEEATKSKKSKGKNKDDPPAKRAKANDDADQNDVPSIAGLNGERLYEIGKLRFISVSQFKGKAYINIREYYDDNGVQKPGKKGISLPADQWEKLKTLFSQVDKDLKKQ